jgi:sporadic carbohydrate cluster protein (TIGR04323 family)
MAISSAIAEKIVTSGDMIAPDAELERSITNEWNAKIVTYPNEKYPFNEWILNRVRKMGYKIDDLSYLHESVPRDEVFKVTKQLCADTNLPEFRRMLHRFAREVIVPKGRLRTPIAVQRFMNVRIMLPTTPDLFFPFHTGLLYGHGIASRSIWMPFTDVSKDEDRTRSMQIMDIHKSRELAQYAIDHELGLDEMTELFRPHTFQIKAGPGSMCFFSQQHIHGSGEPNTTGKTRVSMDWRIAEARYGDLLARKIPAGYVHLVPETEEEEEAIAARPPRKGLFQNGKTNIFYVANNTAATYPIPVHLQRYMLKEYCEKYGLVSHLELFDLEDMRHLPTLQHVVYERNSNCVMYSIFSLPEDEAVRNKMLETALKRGNILHFVNEDMALATDYDLDDIKKYLSFARYGKSRMPIGLPLSQLSREYFAKWNKALSG